MDHECSEKERGACNEGNLSSPRDAIKSEPENTSVVRGTLRDECRPYICDVCNKSFSQKTHLNTHQRIHSGERPYICDVCNKAFRKRYNLTVHERINSCKKPFSCDVCNNTFITRGNLQSHQRRHNEERRLC
jgi:uncharacterized Zn-finger protein